MAIEGPRGWLDEPPSRVKPRALDENTPHTHETPPTHRVRWSREGEKSPRVREVSGVREREREHELGFEAWRL